MPAVPDDPDEGIWTDVDFADVDDDPDGPAVEGDDSELALVIMDLKAAREDRKAAERREAVAKEAALSLMGNRVRVTVPGAGTLSLSTYTRRDVDRKRLEALWPDVWKDVMSESEVTSLRLT